MFSSQLFRAVYVVGTEFQGQRREVVRIDIILLCT